MTEKTDREKQQELEEMCEKFAGMFKVPELGAAEVQEKMQATEGNVVLLDCRNPEEQKVSMLPGALTRAEYAARKEELDQQPVVCYCTVGYRSSEEAVSLRKQGIEAYNMRGSLMAWTHEQLPLVDGADRSSPSTTVHSYSPDWALQGTGYSSVAYPRPRMRLIWDVMASKLPRWW